MLKKDNRIHIFVISYIPGHFMYILRLGASEEKSPVGKPRNRWEDNI
jgi:hypothetical protein